MADFEGSIESRLKAILRSQLQVSSELVDRCGPDTPLLGRGLGLDSMETLTLVSAIEREFDLLVPDEDLNLSLFETLRTLCDYIDRNSSSVDFEVDPS